MITRKVIGGYIWSKNKVSEMSMIEICRDHFQRAINHLMAASLVQAGGADDHLGDAVGVAVAGRATILKVAVAVVVGLARNANRSTTVGDSPRELANVSSFVVASQTALVVFTTLGVVLDNVVHVTLLELGDGIFDGP